MTPFTSSPLHERRVKAQAPRRFPRQRVEALMYVELGPENGGFPINLSEDGMAFQGVHPLEINQEISVKIKLDGIDEPLTATGKIVWLTQSRKGGGLQFIDLPEAARRLINNWISLQGHVGTRPQGPTAGVPHFKALGSPIAPAGPSAVDHGNSSAETSTNLATQPPTVIPPVAKEGPAIPAKIPRKAKPEAKKEQPKPHPQASTDSKRSPHILIPGAKREKKRSRIRSYGFILGLAACIAMITASSVILWPIRASLLAHLRRYIPAQLDVLPPSPPPPLPVNQKSAVEPSTDPGLIELTPLAPIPNEPENLMLLAPVNMAMNAPIHTAENPKPSGQPKNHAATSKVPGMPLAGIRPTGPAMMPGKGKPAAVAQAKVISEGVMELPSPGIPEGTASSLSASLSENSANPTGTVEIIPEPYPSIRVPAQSRERLARPGARLQIGRLVSKAEPVYPQEALRQRIGGTVKLHLVIAGNGSIVRADLIAGPWLLAQAALRAVQQWRYEPTILGGEAIQVDDDVTVVFRITSPEPPAN